MSRSIGSARRFSAPGASPPATIPAAAAIIEAFDLLRLPLAHLFLADSAKVEILRCRRILPTVGRPEQLAARLWDGLIPLSETALQVGARFVIRSGDPSIKRAAWFTLYGLDFLAPGPVAWRALPQQVAMSAFAAAMAQPLTAPIGPFEAVLQHRSSSGINGVNTYIKALEFAD